MANVNDLQSMWSEIFCVFPPPQLPQQRQHQKQQPHTRKLTARSAPRTQTVMIPAHHVANWVKRQRQWRHTPTSLADYLHFWAIQWGQSLVTDYQWDSSAEQNRALPEKSVPPWFDLDQWNIKHESYSTLEFQHIRGKGWLANSYMIPWYKTKDAISCHMITWSGCLDPNGYGFTHKLTTLGNCLVNKVL